MTRNRRWTAEDDDALRALEGVPAETAGKVLDRPTAAVAKRRERLGLSARHRRWAEEDRRFIVSQAQEWTWPRLAEHFDVSVTAVRKAAYRAGVRGEDARFELTASQVAELCGVSVKAVTRWISRGELSAWKTTPNAPKRVPPRHLRAFLLERRRGVVQLVPQAMLELLSRDKVEVDEEVGFEACAAMAAARVHEVKRWAERKWLPTRGQALPVRAKDFKAFALNMPEVVPSLRRVPVETLQLIADMWG